MSETFFASQSSIETYKLCNYKFYLKYIERVEGISSPDDRKPAIFGNIVHKALELYFPDKKKNLINLYKEEFAKSELTDEAFYDMGIKLIQDYADDSESGAKILGVEIPFELFLPNGVPVKGIIDRIDEISEDEIEIIDYKTGRSSLAEDDLKYNLQLGIYDLVARAMFPKHKKVKLTLNYLHFGKLSHTRTDEERNKLLDYLSMIYNKIDNLFQNPVANNIKPKINNLCSFCDYKFKCPEYQNLIKSHGEEEKEFKGLISKSADLVVDIEKLDDFLAAIKAKSKLLKDMQEQVNSFIKDYIKANGSGDSAKIGKKTFSLAKKKYIQYDVNTVIEVLKDKVDLNVVLEPLKSQVDYYAEKDLVAFTKLRKTQKTVFSKAYVK